MAYYPFSPEIGARYALTSPDGLSQAVFNDAFDSNYVGVLSEVTGLDSADIRESAAELVEADGGTHGNFYFSRRPITMTGLVFNNASNYQRQQRLDKITRSSLALRGDAALTWKPAVRRENLWINPSVEVDSANFGIVGGVASTPTVAGGYGSKVLRVTANGAVAFGPYLGVSHPGVRVPVVPGQPISVGVNVVSLPAGRTMRIGIDYVTSGGTQLTGDYTQPLSSTLGWRTLLGSVPPATAAYAVPTFYTNAGANGEAMDLDGFMVVNGTTLASYFDGDTPGYFWAGVAHASQSGDFVEMYVPVRRQQPMRITGAFNKTFLLSLVSQYATMFSVYQRQNGIASNGGTVGLDNRGNYAAYPIVRITGGGLANPTFTINGVTFTTAGQGLTIASGETLEVDFLNHTASFTAGARIGQSANRYINFASTVWPFIPAGGNSFVATLGGTGAGSAVVLWRDTWA